MSKPPDLEYLRREVEARETGVSNAKAKWERHQQGAKDRRADLDLAKEKLAAAKATLAAAEKNNATASAGVAEGKGEA